MNTNSPNMLPAAMILLAAAMLLIVIGTLGDLGSWSIALIIGGIALAFVSAIGFVIKSGGGSEND